MRANNSWASKYLNFLIRHKKLINLFFLVSVIGSFFATKKLQLKTDFATLLPDNLPSVKNIRHLESRLGNTGILVVGVVSPNFEANKRFIEDLAKLMKPHVGPELRYLDYKYKDVEDFIYKFGLSYLSTDKLKEIHKIILESVEKKKDEAFSSFLGISEEKKKVPRFKDFAQKILDPSLRKFLDYREAYLSAEDGHVLAMAIRPSNELKSLAATTRLVNLVQDYIRKLNPKNYDPEMQTSLSGNIKQSVEEYETLKKDLFDTSLLLVSLILGVLFLFFWNFSILGLLSVSLVSAVLWTFALTYFHIGYLNSQTAFLGSIVVGTGINYGIIYLARVIEYLRSGNNIFNSVYLAIENSLIATVIASGSTAIAFCSLFITENKGLSQFAFIGGIGVCFCWLVSFTFLPLWTYQLLENGIMKIKKHPFSYAVGRWSVAASHWILRKPWIVGSFIVVCSFLSFVGFHQISNDLIEYNFDKVRNRNIVAPEIQSLRKRVHKVFSVNLNPSIILTDSQEKAKLICPSFYALKKTIPPEINMLDECLSLQHYLPPEAKISHEKRDWLLKLKTLFEDRLVRDSEYGVRLAHFAKNMELRVPTLKDMPDQMLHRFRENNGNLGLYAYVYPDSEKPINDGRNLIEFTNRLKDMPLIPTGETVSAAGNSFVFADLLEGIKRDAPLVSIISFVGVLLITFFLSGGWKSALFLGACLSLGVLWMFGMQGFAGIKYNFFNFIALPLTFGIGVDYPANVFVRCRQENFKNMHTIIRNSGTAVILCSLTTIIGYYTLVGSASQALDSFARIALYGEITCLIVAILVVPWGIERFKRNSK